MFEMRRYPMIFAVIISVIVGCRKTEEPVSDQDAPGADTASRSNDADLGETPGLKQGKRFVPLAGVVAALDPKKDEGWESEAFHEAAGSQLKKIGKLITDSKYRTAKKNAEIVTGDFQSDPLRPETMEVFRDDALIVLRENPSSDKVKVATLGEAIETLDKSFGSGNRSDARFKFKVVRVNLEGELAETDAYFETSAKTTSGVVQINSTWTCQWQLERDNLPKLKRIKIRDYEEIRPNKKSGPLFTDCTEAVLADNKAYADQLAYGADYWYGNLDVAFGVHQGNQGLALGDVDGDGREDLYVCQPAGLPNQLFLRQPDGTLKQHTRESNVDWLDLSRCALFADLDNDGDQDLVVAVRWSLLVHKNDGSGRFTVDKIIDTKFNLISVTTADYDNDGDLDLYVCGYSPGPEGAPTDIFANPVPYHDANNGGRNFLLRNDRNFEFVDVTEQTGLDYNNRKFSFAAAWEDYDNDGDVDLYVANDFGRNNLFRNDHGYFRDVAADAGVEDIGAGMSVSWADYNHDGLMDLYVSNMFSSAGNRIAFQKRFREGSDSETIQHLQRHARGNSLFKNLGNGRFEDMSETANVTLGRWAWGSLFTDLNNDGWDDIYVVNGFYTTEDTGDL